MKHSAGIICYRYNWGELEIFLVHSTGITGVWSFPKGLVEKDESLLAGALREFHEETKYRLDRDSDAFTYLGSVLQDNGRKTVYAFGHEYPEIDPELCISNMCEHPIGSGQMIYELDDFVWYSVEDAYKYINPRQIPLLDELMIRLGRK